MQNYKRLGLLLVLFVAVVTPLLAQSTSPSSNSQPEPLKFDLLAQVNRTHLLTPALPTFTDTINSAFCRFLY